VQEVLTFLEKGENKTMQDTEKSNRASWDDKFQQLLWQLQDYQEAKNNPQAQVVNMEVEDLCVNPPFIRSQVGFLTLHV
jgi:hypothetical protein